PAGAATRCSTICSTSSNAIASGTTTAHASNWSSCSTPGARPTRRRSRAADGCRPYYSPKHLSCRWRPEGRASMTLNVVYHGPADLPAVIPVFPLPGALLLPRGQVPLNIFEPRYLAMIDDALRSGYRLVGMIQPDTAHAGAPDRPALYRVGCVGRITQL